MTELGFGLVRRLKLGHACSGEGAPPNHDNKANPRTRLVIDVETEE